MDSDDDETLFYPPSSTPSPLRQTTLKRLRRASRFPDEAAFVSSPLIVPTPSIEEPHSVADQVPSLSRSDGGGLEKAVEEADDDGLDSLFGERGQFTGCDAPDLEWGISGELDVSEERDGGEDGSVGLDKGAFDEVEKKSAKKRLDLDWGEEENVGKKKMKKTSGDGDGTPVESRRNKRKLEKERTTLLEQLHAESQKLLRETRDASFKPAPLANKSISSVLEKIRLRKLEMLKKFNSSDFLDSSCDANESLSNDSCQPHASEIPKVVRSSEAVTTDTCQTPESPPVCGASINNDDRQDTDSGQEHHDPAIIVQDSIIDSPVVEEEIIQSEKQPDGYIENVVLTSCGASTEIDPDNLNDTSSDEGEYDKENMDPLEDKHVQNLYNEAVLKTFVDDEAEEEDDSDHDLMRFQDNEDDDESEESEELNDIIATGFKEKPVDQERRNQLHQKWLEQQDAAETDNVLQRINNRVRDREPTILQDEDIAENSGEDSGEDSQDGAVPANAVCGNLKTAKNAIVQMFNDVDGDFVSSDDEETERKLSRQRLLEQAGVGSSVLTPEADENSREVFSLIKKLNIAPDPKKRTGTATQCYDVMLKAENSNSSSRSSFLGRATTNSVPPSCKKGSRTFKSFVFARDDSNSRDATSASDNQPAKGSEEFQPMKTASAKCSISQTKHEVKTGCDSKTSKSSLFEILCRSSLQSDKQNVSHQRTGTRMSESQAARQLTAFKLRNRVPKKL